MNDSRLSWMKRGWRVLLYVVLLAGLCFTATAFASELETDATRHRATAAPVPPGEIVSPLPAVATEASPQPLAVQATYSQASTGTYDTSAANPCGDLGYLPAYQGKQLTPAEIQDVAPGICGQAMVMKNSTVP